MVLQHESTIQISTNKSELEMQRNNEDKSSPSVFTSIEQGSVNNNTKGQNKTNEYKRTRSNKNEEPKKDKNVDNQDENEEPKRKRRKAEKKPMDMPRRALSAYNIFFSEQRKLILEEIERKEKGQHNQKNEEDNASVASSESQSDSVTVNYPHNIRQPDAIPCVSKQRVSNLKRKKRLHRKVHGKINLVLLAREVGKRWKELSDEDRKYYNDLAAEDKVRHTQAMKEYKERKAAESMIKSHQQHQYLHVSEVQQQNQPAMRLESASERSYMTMMKPAHVNPFHQVQAFQPPYSNRQQMYANYATGQNVEYQGPTVSPPGFFASAFQQPHQARSSTRFDMHPSNEIPLTDSERMMIMKCRAAAAAASTKTMMQFVSAHGWHSPVEPSIDTMIRPRTTSV